MCQCPIGLERFVGGARLLVNVLSGFPAPRSECIKYIKIRRPGTANMLNALVKYVVNRELSCDFGILSFPEQPALYTVVTDSNVG